MISVASSNDNKKLILGAYIKHEHFMETMMGINSTLDENVKTYLVKIKKV